MKTKTPTRRTPRTFKQRYEKALSKLLKDTLICKSNRLVFKQFFEWECKKLRRMRNLTILDEACFKTVYGYITRLRNANAWLKNKPWKDLTKEDLQNLFDRLEDGTIKGQHGKPIEDRNNYYHKVFYNKPFKIVGKADLFREIVEEFGKPTKDPRTVSFVNEENFKKLIFVNKNPTHLCLYWLAWDIGENIGALLQLVKSDFERKYNPDIKDYEYLVNLPNHIIKRARQTRTEPTNHKETVQYLDMVLKDLNDTDKLFNFEHRWALEIITTDAEKTGVKCEATKKIPSWKNLRSGMACFLLGKGWTGEEINLRLGHSPSSRQLDAYINYLAVNRKKTKIKIQNTTLEEVKQDLEESKGRERLINSKMGKMNDEMKMLTENVKLMQEQFFEALENEKRRYKKEIIIKTQSLL